MSDVTEVLWGRIRGKLDDLFARVPALSTQVSSLSGTVQGWVDTAKGHADRAKAEADRAGSAATTAVTTRVDALLNGAPAAYDTLKEIADKLANQDDVAAAMLEQIGTKASSTQVDELSNSLVNKANKSHTHQITDVEGLADALDARADEDWVDQVVEDVNKKVEGSGVTKIQVVSSMPSNPSSTTLYLVVE